MQDILSITTPDKKSPCSVVDHSHFLFIWIILFNTKIKFYLNSKKISLIQNYKPQDFIDHWPKNFHRLKHPSIPSQWCSKHCFWNFDSNSSKNLMMKECVGSLVHHDIKTMVKAISLEDNFGELRDHGRGLNIKENDNDSNAFNSTAKLFYKLEPSRLYGNLSWILDFGGFEKEGAVANSLLWLLLYLLIKTER